VGLVCVITEGGSRLLYDERDVASVCKKMRCGHHAEDCKALMKKGAMECVLCYAVLTALKKPCEVKATQPDKGGKTLKKHGQTKYDEASQDKKCVRRG
jgi:hypothetical protein